jgi:hypothetical protein
MAFLETDQDYIDLGATPPERNPSGVAGDDNAGVSAIMNAAGRHKHEWKAYGNYIECTKGDHIHGHPYDHVNNVLEGTDQYGDPIFRKLDMKKIMRDDKQ